MTNIENSRNCLRRLIHDDKEFSNQSIINVIERFVKSVNMMEETILIPSRLMDRQVGDATDSVKPAVEKTYHHHHHHHHNKKKSSNNIHDCLGNTDLFNLYSMLNSVKVDLLWGRNGQEEDMTETVSSKKNEQNSENNTGTVTDVVAETNTLSAPQQQQQTTNTASTESRKGGHVRQPSTVSLSSSNSSTISDSESEVSSNENDSGIESENQQNKDRSLEVAKQFRTHLIGLYKSLEQMTEAASYLTSRYQSDMGGC